jgi:hypothetical protein
VKTALTPVLDRLDKLEEGLKEALKEGLKEVNTTLKSLVDKLDKVPGLDTK